MKKLFVTVVAIISAFCLSACADNDVTNNQSVEKDGKILVAYFSQTGHTKVIAEKIASETDADLFEITAQMPYMPEDLDSNNVNSRSAIERDDPSARPAIGSTLEDVSKYDVVFLGYPIWHAKSPKIISAFVETYDLSGKRVIPFCTSASSDIDASFEELAPNANWENGMRFAVDSSERNIENWIDSLNLENED